MPQMIVPNRGEAFLSGGGLTFPCSYLLSLLFFFSNLTLLSRLTLNVLDCIVTPLITPSPSSSSLFNYAVLSHSPQRH